MLSSSKGNFHLKILAVFISFVIIILILLLYLNNKKSEEKDILELDLVLEKESFYNNQSLNFLTKLYYNKKCDGLVQYEIFRLNNISVVINKNEDIKLSGKVSRDDAFSLNKLSSGNYILRAKIRCNDKLEISIAKFSILSKEKNIFNISDKASIKQNISDNKFSENISMKKTEELSPSEIIALSNQNPNKAEQMCNSLSTEKKDECLSVIAEKTKNKDYCSKVQDVSIRDGCYLSLVLEGIYIDCADIYDSNQREACVSLKSNKKS